MLYVVRKHTMMMPTLVNFSSWLRIYSWLELRGKWGVSYVPQVREEQMVRICLYICVDLPIIVGVWSMVVVLWQLLQYFGCDILKLTVLSNVDLKEISNSM